MLRLGNFVFERMEYVCRLGFKLFSLKGVLEPYDVVAYE